MISSLAIIEDGAVIGKNVEISPYVFISKNSRIGDNTKIAQGACIYGNTTIGKGNEIFSYAVLGSIPQDLKYGGEDVELIIGDNNKIREFTLINPGTKGGGSKTIIANNNLIMAHVHLAHDVILGSNCIIANASILAGHVELGDGVVIGGNTPIHQFCKIGDFAMIGGASALGQDIPPYCLAEGRRATIKGLNLIGLRRKIDRSSIDELKIAYKELFEKGNSLLDIAKDLFDNSKDKYVKNLCSFILNNTRGIPYDRKAK